MALPIQDPTVHSAAKKQKPITSFSQGKREIGIPSEGHH
jgi:hypothetical protein